MRSLTMKKLGSACAVATVTVLIGGLGLAGCSGSETTSGGGDDVAVGEDAGTELTRENFFEELSAAQVEAGSARVTMDLGEAAGGVAMQGDVVIGESVEDTAMTATLETGDTGPGTVEMRLVDGVLYMNLGAMTEDRFAALDLQDEDDPVVQQFGSLTDSFDPARQLETLEGAVTGFEQAGAPEQLDGVEATPYSVSVDGAAIVENAGQDPSALGGAVPDELVYTFYVGPDNLPRRIVTDATAMSLTMDFSRWGEEVVVEKPADDEITTESPFGRAG
ncbi:hypothetical protein GCM10009821_12690 [Aeromicrobium halocynthiae]|uniref:LppX_LprAFG lipoprotein n=1 Tax=Aeromicrobium halocynthiae TaxID=560557 RepID=A0ABN2VWJ5_9ACTN